MYRKVGATGNLTELQIWRITSMQSMYLKWGIGEDGDTGEEGGGYSIVGVVEVGPWYYQKLNLPALAIWSIDWLIT